MVVAAHTLVPARFAASLQHITPQHHRHSCERLSFVSNLATHVSELTPRYSGGGLFALAKPGGAMGLSASTHTFRSSPVPRPGERQARRTTLKTAGRVILAGPQGLLFVSLSQVATRRNPTAHASDHEATPGGQRKLKPSPPCLLSPPVCCELVCVSFTLDTPV